MPLSCQKDSNKYWLIYNDKMRQEEAGEEKEQEEEEIFYLYPSTPY